jgi:hypothetical protein
VNEDHRNPYRRVVSVDVMDRSRRYYDKEKYVELVLDAAETILGIFGFRKRAPHRLSPRCPNSTRHMST